MAKVRETQITPIGNKLLREWFGEKFFVVGAYETSDLMVYVVIASGNLYVMRYFWIGDRENGRWEKSQDEKRPLRDVVRVGMELAHDTETVRIGFVTGNLYDNLVSQVEVTAERSKIMESLEGKDG